MVMRMNLSLIFKFLVIGLISLIVYVLGTYIMYTIGIIDGATLEKITDIAFILVIVLGYGLLTVRDALNKH